MDKKRSGEERSDKVFEVSYAVQRVDVAMVSAHMITVLLAAAVASF